MADVSALPPIIDQDLMLAVYTHDSLSTAADHDPKSPARLAFLGRHVLNQALAYHHFMKEPPMVVGDLQNQLTSLDSVHLLNTSGARRRIVSPPETQASLDTELEARHFFHKYLGALFLESGPEAIQQWVSKAIYPQEPVPSPPTKNGRSYQRGSAQPQAFPPPPSHFPPPYSQSNASTASQGSKLDKAKLNILAQLNLAAQQKHYTVTYPARFEGPPHAPTWTVQCCLNGEIKGQGVGSSQREAKELAAREAWVATGWGRLLE